MKEHYRRVLADSEQSVKHALSRQVEDESHPFYGGFYDANKMVEAKYAIYQVTTMIGTYCNSESSYYLDKNVEKSIFKGMDYIERMQHENGLFDYIDCNFYSAPDTAFMIKGMMPALHYLKEHNRNEVQERIYQQYYQIGKKAAYGLLEGGFHTPNHRWAIASALYECADFFDAPRLLEGCSQYLREGIDCNEDGEFSEKSAGTYNGVNDEAMIMMGDYSGNSKYYEYAIRNLKMMLHYIEPDGTIFTSNSTRQDNGKRVFPTEYYWMYLRMGREHNIPEFLSMANYIFDLINKYNLKSPDILLFFMNKPEYISFEYDDHSINNVYHSFYRESGIARIACGNYSYTIMKGKSNFLYFSNESIDLAVKIGGSLCEHRAFIPETMKDSDGIIELEQTMKGWYYLPFKEKPATSNWWEMDHQSRDKLHGPDIRIHVQILPAENGIDIKMKVSGVQYAPFRVEVTILGSRMIESEHFSVPAVPGGYIIAKDGMVQAYNDENAVTIGPAFGNHLYTSGKFGSEERQREGFTLYFTDYTEFEHTIEIRNI